MSFTLEDYKIQRQYREKRRKEYLSQFQVLRTKLGLTRAQQPDSEIKVPAANLPSQDQTNATKNEQKRNVEDEESRLALENTKLKSKVQQIDREERQKLQKLKTQISAAKQNYLNQMKEINELGATQKKQTNAKIKKLQEQIKSSIEKNKEITDFNLRMQDECNKGEQLMEKYETTIREEYDQKLQQFNNVFNASTEKIQQMESQYNNDDEFVENTLQSEQLIQSLRENAEKTNEDLDKMIEDYKELLKGKEEILIQLTENNKMKADEITKMALLQQKMKTIFEKMNEEKKIYLEENTKMASELLEVKDLLSKTIGG